MKLPVTESFALEGLKLEDVFEDHFCRGRDKKYANVSQFKPNSIKKRETLEAIRAYVDEKFHLTEYGYVLDKLWLVESTPKDIKEGELPYIPHIDYHRFLKVMIYVDDVAEANGPFSAVSVNPDEFEPFRLSLKADYKQNKRNQVRQFSLREYEMYTSPKGTMILFDTNCPHFAATVFPGNRRRVFRFDYELPSWKRKESLFLKLKRLF